MEPLLFDVVERQLTTDLSSKIAFSLIYTFLSIIHPFLIVELAPITHESAINELFI